MARANALALIAVLTAFAGVFALAFDFSVLIFVGAVGLIAAFSEYITDPRQKLSSQSYILRPLDDPTRASQYNDPDAGGGRRWIWRFVVVAYAVAIIVLGVAFSARSVSTKDYEERFVSTVCWFVTYEEKPARCGFLFVPERRDRPNGRELTLPVVILERSTAISRRPPILYLTGGPGSPTYLENDREIDYWWEIAETFPRGHDFILIDQRGTGMGDPWLGCMELEDPRVWGGLTETPNTTIDHLNVWREGVTACRDRLIQLGVDLSAYNSSESAGDIAALGRLLDPAGRQKMTLYGVSYGTQLALTVMRDHPNIIHSAILDSVAPLQANWTRDASAYLDGALAAVFRDCSANPDCARAYPRLRVSLERALDRLRTDPIELELNQSTHFPSIELDQPLYAVVDDTTLLDVLHWALYYPAQVPHLPLLIHGLGEGEFWRLKFYLEGLFLDPYWLDSATGMSFSVDCYEEFPFESREAVETAVDHYPFFRRWALRGWDYNVCDIWPSGRAMPAENLPVQSDIPALLLSGTYDPVTPPELAHVAAATLPNSYVFVFPSESHGVSFTHPCAKQIAVEFVNDPNAQPKSGCLASLKPRDFLSLGSSREGQGAPSQGDQRGRVD